MLSAVLNMTCYNIFLDIRPIRAACRPLPESMGVWYNNTGFRQIL